MSVDPRLRRAQIPTPQPPAQVPPPPPPPVVMEQPQADGVQAATNKDIVPDDAFKLKFCTVCASNQNRYVPLFVIN